MKTYNEFILTELFDNPLKWKWTRKSEGWWRAEFLSGENLYRFSATGGSAGWGIEFSLETEGVPMSYGNTGTGNAPKVFATVISIIKDFLNKVSPEKVNFSGDKAFGKSALYSKMLKKMSSEIKKTGYEVIRTELSKFMMFTLRRKKR